MNQSSSPRSYIYSFDEDAHDLVDVGAADGAGGEAAGALVADGGVAAGDEGAAVGGVEWREADGALRGIVLFLLFGREERQARGEGSGAPVRRRQGGGARCCRRELIMCGGGFLEEHALGLGFGAVGGLLASGLGEDLVEEVPELVAIAQSGFEGSEGDGGVDGEVVGHLEREVVRREGRLRGDEVLEDFDGGVLDGDPEDGLGRLAGRQGEGAVEGTTELVDEPPHQGQAARAHRGVDRREASESKVLGEGPPEVHVHPRPTQDLLLGGGDGDSA
mmetsp:Transcript_21978/g.70797  ORF Transcript_21978/g.70797 Transcript_21978/m.70797 type:complete len:276 (-) Transcript_21978:873-1700(-)